MATTITSSASAPVTDNTTRWPVFATKAAFLTELVNSPSPSPWLNDIIKRVSNTDITNWDADKGSIVS